MSDRTCKIDGCDKRGVAGFGWCSKHYNRWRRTGDPLHERGFGYSAAHQRLKNAFGSASQYPCADCGKTSRDWSLNNETTGTIYTGRITSTGSRDFRWSDEPSDYSPRCTSCHRRSEESSVGERNNKAKLTAVEVLEIFASVESRPVLAKRYGVGITTIAKIRSGDTWSHVTGKLPSRPRPEPSP